MLIRKCHDQKVVTIVGLVNSMSEGVLLRGRVIFFPRSTMFGFVEEGAHESEMQVLPRDEWAVTMCEHMYEHLACNQK